MYLKSVIVLALMFAMLSINSQAETMEDNGVVVEIKNYKDSLSYSLGYNIGKNLENNISNDSIDISKNALLAGFQDGFAKGTGVITEEAIQQVMLLFQQELKAKQDLKMQQEEQMRNSMGEESRIQGEEFLARNRNEEGVKVTESGLQYKIINQGEGKRPTATNTVKVHYTGRLVDGKVFDSSVQRGEPIEFPLNGVIPGWTEGLQYVNEGGTILLFIPSDLAYGERGAGASIPPNSTLIFEVQLLEITK